MNKEVFGVAGEKNMTPSLDAEFTSIKISVDFTSSTKDNIFKNL